TLVALPAVEGTERELLSGLCSSLRDSLLLGLAGEAHPLVEADEAARRRSRERFDRLGCERIEAWLAERPRARERIELLKSAPARLILETTLLDLCRPETSMPLAELEERLLALEARLKSAGTAAPVAPAPREVAPRTPPAPSGGSADLWTRLLATLDSEACTM